MEHFYFWISLFIVLGLIQSLFYLYFRLRFPNLKMQKESLEVSVSVIIAFRNEEENLKRIIPLLLDQEHREFELILVNDHSDDNSVELINSFHDPRIRILNNEDGRGKKAAIQLGIRAAENNLLLFTDADCIPSSVKWLGMLANPLIEGYSISLGYGRFERNWGILNKLQRYENFMNNLQNFSYANKGRAFMGVGRNMAYRKELFHESKAFENLSHIRSGDDDLIINEMSELGNTAIVLNPLAETISEATNSWKSFFFQKRRHLEAGKYYRTADRFKLAILGLSQLFFNLLFITLLFLGQDVPLILAIFATKTVFQLLLYVSPLKRLREFDLLIFIPLLEMIYLPIISLIGLSQYLWRVDRWK